MSVSIQVGNQTFLFPGSGAEPGWAESMTATVVALANSLGNLTSVGDIPLTNFTLTNNTTTFSDITGMQLIAGLVRASNISYVVYRKTSTTSVVESGTLLVNYDASGSPVWNMTQSKNGDAGVIFEINGSGQIQYKSSNLGGTVDTTNHYIKFTAKSLPST